MFSVVRLGDAAELLFWPDGDPLPGPERHRGPGAGRGRLGFRNLGNVVLPANRFVEFRFDWHASGQARILADGRLVAYHNAVAPGALLNFDRVAFGMGNVTPASPQPLYHLSRIFVRALARPAGNHIYQPRHADLLALRSYAGKWGGHDGIVDKSPPFAPKTGRYFRKLLDKL